MLRWTETYQSKLDELIELNDKNQIEGIYPDIPIEVYHHPLCPGFSKTDLDVAARSYEHLQAMKADRIQAYRDPEAEEKRNLVIGSAFHDSLFTPDRFADLYALAPIEPTPPEDINRRTKQGKEDFKAWEATTLTPWKAEVLEPFRKGKVAVTSAELEMLSKMKAKADEHDSFQAIIRPAKKEFTIFFRDPKTGILLKVRPDAISEAVKICLDAKTTQDARPVEFRRTIANYNYDKQAALQIDGCRAIFGVVFDFVFSAHEKEDPFGIALYRLDDACLDVGRQLYRRDLDYLKGVNEKTAPRGYSPDIVSIGLPAWGFDISSR